MKEHNKDLAEAAQQAGITEPIDYAIFQNKGYQDLYGGLNFAPTKCDIHSVRTVIIALFPYTALRHPQS